MKQEQRTFEDPVIPAGLKCIDPLIEVRARKLPTGRIGFDVSGNNLDELLQRLFSNASVGWIDFVKELKSLRGSIFALKTGGQR
jgi:hypothetical protein